MSARRASWRFERQNRPDPHGRGIVLYDFEGDLLGGGDDPGTALTWIGRGERVTIGGYDLTDPMIYAGPQPDIYHPAFEPSAIDLDREIAPGQPPRAAISVHSWHPWAAMTPSLRGSYLAWIAGGRRDAGAPDSFPSLYLCGLERRLFVDLGVSGPVPPDQQAEVSAIRDEVAGLVAAYGPRLALGNASRLLAILDLVLRNAAAFRQPPPLDPDRDRVPLDLAIGLGVLVAAGEPIPAEWALAWAWYRPDMPFTAGATRCPEEVRHLFMLRYRQREGDGMLLRPGTTELRPAYEPLNTGVPKPRLAMPGLPDVFLRRNAGVALSPIVAWVCDDLEPYARWIARNPTRSGTMMSLLQLPALLLERDLPIARRVRTWLSLALGEYDEPVPGTVAVTAGADLIALWGQEPPDRLTKGESEMLAQVLERFGVGLEPDVRFDGPPITHRMPVALFRAPDGAECVPVRASSAAGAVVALALVLGAPLLTTGDPARPLTGSERSLLLRVIGGGATADPGLSPLDAVRLQAAVARLAPLDPKPSGLKRRIDAPHPADRLRIGGLLVRIAAEGASDLPPKVVSLLQRQFRALHLDPATVPSRLHAASTAPTTTPANARSEGVMADRQAPAGRGGRVPVRLDHETISRTREESDTVSALLGDLLADEALPAERPEDRMSVPAAPSAPDGLDAAHSAFLHDLAGRESWSTADASDLASRHHLLLGGAIDTINEWAIEQTGDPAIAGDDTLSIDRDVLSGIPLPHGTRDRGTS
ncbi:MAG: TerB N-terminal domain-containing protein [Thermomicrobiales bacterium]